MRDAYEFFYDRRKSYSGCGESVGHFVSRDHVARRPLEFQGGVVNKPGPKGQTWQKDYWSEEFRTKIQ